MVFFRMEISRLRLTSHPEASLLATERLLGRLAERTWLGWSQVFIQVTRPGKLTVCYGKSPFFMDKSTISMAIFNSKLLVYQRVLVLDWESHGWEVLPISIIHMTPQRFGSTAANHRGIKKGTISTPNMFCRPLSGGGWVQWKIYPTQKIWQTHRIDMDQDGSRWCVSVMASWIHFGGWKPLRKILEQRHPLWPLGPRMAVEPHDVDDVTLWWFHEVSLIPRIILNPMF